MALVTLRSDQPLECIEPRIQIVSMRYLQHIARHMNAMFDPAARDFGAHRTAEDVMVMGRCTVGRSKPLREYGWWLSVRGALTGVERNAAGLGVGEAGYVDAGYVDASRAHSEKPEAGDARGWWSE